MAVLQNVIHTVTVQNANDGSLGGEHPIGALASNVAVDSLESEVSVQDKINDYNTFIENLSTDNVKYIKDEVTQKLTDYLNKCVTTDDKSEGIEEQVGEGAENDNIKYVTAKTVIDYLTGKTNQEVKSTSEIVDNNLVTDNAVFQYIQNILPSAAEGFEETENNKYVTVALFNSKYIPMFEEDLTDDTVDTTTLVNPNQVVSYVKTKVETGEIQEGSNKLVTSGTLYNKFLYMPSLLQVDINSEINGSEDKIYVNAYQVKSYVNNKIPQVASESLTDASSNINSFTNPYLVASYMLSKYIGTIEDITEESEIETGKTDAEGNPIIETVSISRKKVVHTAIKDIIPEDESTLDIDNVYFKGFVTPKQVVDYVKVASEITDETTDNTSFVTPLQVAEYVIPKLNVDKALNFQDMTSTNAIAHSAVAKEFTYVKNFLGVSTYNEDGSYAGNTIPQQLEAILTRLVAVEEAVKVETTAD